MKKISLGVAVAAASIFIMMFLEGRAEAYLDGGTGSMIFQVIVGGLAGIILAIKLFWHKIVQLFTGKKSTNNDSTSPKN